MSLDARQVLEYVIRPTLRELGEPYGGRSAERLVLGTAAVESGLRWIRQVGGGPALGLWQMEPATYRDLWQTVLARRKDLEARVLSFGPGGLGFPDPAELVWNLKLAAAMCRFHYLRDPAKLPEPDDVRGFAETWKRVYNTRAGAGTVADGFLRAWSRLVSPILN